MGNQRVSVDRQSACGLHGNIGVQVHDLPAFEHGAIAFRERLVSALQRPGQNFGNRDRRDCELYSPCSRSQQHASHTLASRRGNAFDIASLTIALLRAAGIPARYVHGTIDVPEDRFRDRVGGFENVDAAMDFASAGGIPIAAVVSGGRISKVRLEHVWVEAAVDFTPSRGVKIRSADSWVAMDASFKQLDVLSGIDVIQVSRSRPRGGRRCGAGKRDDQSSGRVGHRVRSGHSAERRRSSERVAG